MYWQFMCFEVTLLTKFRITLIAWIFDSLMCRHFMFFEATLVAEFWFTLIAWVFDYLIPSCSDISYVLDSLIYWNFICHYDFMGICWNPVQIKWPQNKMYKKYIFNSDVLNAKGVIPNWKSQNLLSLQIGKVFMRHRRFMNLPNLLLHTLDPKPKFFGFGI